jgi:hypothetical protein
MNGMAQPTSLILFEPLAGRHYLKTNSHRKAVDWASVIKSLPDEYYPDTKVIVLTMDNLNTHKLASFYEAFEPEGAHRLSRRFEIHTTPKHGSWLNMAEIELSAFMSQCVKRRIPDQATLDAEVKAWTQDRNDMVIKVDWRFTTADACINLKHLYQKIHV